MSTLLPIALSLPRSPAPTRPPDFINQIQDRGPAIDGADGRAGASAAQAARWRCARLPTTRICSTTSA